MAKMKLPEGVKLTEDQKAFGNKAIQTARSQSRYFEGAGFSGTGKTFMLRMLVQYFLDQGKNVHLSAPTHKALGQIKDKLGEELAAKVNIRTLHALHGLKPVQTSSGRAFKRDPMEEKEHFSVDDVLIIDEASMVEMKLHQITLDEKSRWNLVVLNIGDPAQLPPVDEESKHMPALSSPDHTMTQIVRQGEANPIVKMAEVLRSTAMPSLTKFRRAYQGPLARDGEGVWFYDRRSDWVKSMKRLFSGEKIKEDNTYGRALAYRNDTVEKINRAMRRSVRGAKSARENPYLPGEWLVAQEPWSPGPDAPTAIQNSQEVRVLSSEESTHRGYECLRLSVRFARSGKERSVWVPDPSSRGKAWRRKVRSLKIEAKRSSKGYDWKKYYQAKEALANMRHGYAETVHKSQGSTFQHVFVHWKDLKVAQEVASLEELRALQYVALTRAAKTVHILT